MTEKQIMTFIIHAIEDCSYCKAARKLLMSKDVSFVFNTHNKDSVDLIEQIKEESNWQTFPIISVVEKVGDEEQEVFLGGFEELEKYFSDQ